MNAVAALCSVAVVSAALLGAAVALVLGRLVSGFTEGLLPVAAGGFIYVASASR